MTSVDTNVLVRLLVADDAEQHAQARAVFEREDVFVPDTVLLETEWVLRYAYGLTATRVTDALRRVLGLPNVHVRDPQCVHQALAWHADGLDFADALHLALSQEQNRLVTFDRAFIRDAAGRSPCAVEAPSTA